MEPTNNDPSQMEINISNKNAKGQIVLNDQKLLEQIVLYPFLYNPRVSPYHDTDYEGWAWQNIATAFNENYESLTLETSFTSLQLKVRWEELKPIIATLMRAQDAIPTSLKRLIVEINLGSSQTGELNSRALSKVENLILENIPMVENLPLRERKRLETEVMELLLKTELEGHGTVRLDQGELDIIEKECNEFLQTISIKNLAAIDNKSENTQLASDFIAEFNMERDSNSSAIQLNEDILMNDLQQSDENLMDYRLDTDITNKIALEVNSGPGQLDYEEVDTNPPEQLLADVKIDSTTIVRLESTDQSSDSGTGQDEVPHEQLVVNDNSTAKELTCPQKETPRITVNGEALMNGTHIAKDKSSIIELTSTHEEKDESPKKDVGTICSTSTVTTNNILICPNQKLQNEYEGGNRLLPAKSASNYIKNVKVRVKRMNLDDYIPLAKFRATRRTRRR